ncbi:N-acetylmuramoyl-L-alanine amidase [Mucilaginibacter daejeonensis]|uniref:N-acetylmuramoyl-L-alanine amidase family protein n=1 Tax=Mucilaginibacter daejeonensis TaxID=398049 RepID=UPI001D17B6F7|nr:N-acetylmuramoyl-L-alanine amidase [Mucilaginibacter daejeonensis]UEG51992.1 N-acetylmuramoyl-L-alanine amidase [Mucilaginibacter daejeonensis]
MKNKALKTYIYGLLALLICYSELTLASPFSDSVDTTVSTGFKLRTIVIDAGHGGRAGGAQGAYSMEKNVTLAIALKLRQAIQKEFKDVNVLMTRTSDVTLANGLRAVMANENKANLYISLHCNSLPNVRKVVNGKTVSVPNRSGKGVLFLINRFGRSNEQVAAIRENQMAEEEESLTKRTEVKVDPAEAMMLNAFRDKFRKQSVHLANLINNEFIDTDGRASLGVIEQGVQVLANTSMPSILIETGFINNPEEEDYLNSEEGQTEIVNSIVRGLKTYKNEVERVAP